MNESDLEKELRSLLPMKPSAQLAERIAADLKTPARREPEPAAGLINRPAKQQDANRFKRPWFLALAGLAVVMISLLTVALLTKPGSAKLASKPEAPNTVAALSETPDQSVDELIDAKDEGLVYGEDDELQRQVRAVYIERHTWTNPQTGAVVEFEVPREDIVLMPVAMQ